MTNCNKCEKELNVGEFMENRLITKRDGEKIFCNFCYEKIKENIFNEEKNGEKRDRTRNKL